MSEAVTTSNGAELIVLAAQPADQNPAIVYLAGLKESSRRTMRKELDMIARLLTSGRQDALQFPWGSVRFQHVNAIRAALSDRPRGELPYEHMTAGRLARLDVPLAAATANLILAAVRGAVRAACKLHQISADDYREAFDIKPIKGSKDEPAGRALTEGEVRALFDACMADLSPAGFRDAAILALALGAGGLRRTEFVDLDLASFELVDASDGNAWGRLAVRGKGNKTRTVPVENSVLEALRDWLSVRGQTPGPLFPAVNKGGTMRQNGERLSSQAILNLTSKRAAEAGIARFSPHDLRRTFISDLLDAGADIETVRKLAGHASVTTTARYDRRGERAKRQAVNRLHVPYQRRRLD